MESLLFDSIENLVVSHERNTHLIEHTIL